MTVGSTERSSGRGGFPTARADPGSPMTFEETNVPTARAGDRLTVRGIHGQPARSGEIREVLGARAHKADSLRWRDGPESIVFPADGASVVRVSGHR